MANFILHQNAFDKCNNAVVISGGARNGTTIIGKIIHSLKNIEYFFEPPTLVSLFPLIDQLPEAEWKLLYETYLYEDMLLNALAGRNLNHNLEDDSSIFKVKMQEDIENRKQRSLGKTELTELAEERIIAFKNPDLVPYLPKLVRLYPETKNVVMRRNPSDAISSIIEKKWFGNHEQVLIWPTKVYKESVIPYWVKSSEEELWLDLTEEDRAAYYYIRMMEAYPELEKKLVLNYEELVESPRKVTERLSTFIGAEITSKTEEILSNIYMRNINGKTEKLNVLSEEMRKKVQDAYERSLT
ncbi:hypothetical protein C0J08_03370 [Marinomonas sp. CT5]|uniref:sulfotransferase n=1 Tax=Marinomonas sp. CT5 TaxID=2066133 RepID=UPI001BAE90D1|nr:sulfotransferase [Marinomonas sp. CT5]QUX94510.1 hypothetical protein C0J08_03370 [Marinomonas sp. CT5]